jgi:hypothetical protein
MGRSLFFSSSRSPLTDPLPKEITVTHLLSSSLRASQSHCSSRLQPFAYVRENRTKKNQSCDPGAADKQIRSERDNRLFWLPSVRVQCWFNGQMTSRSSHNYWELTHGLGCSDGTTPYTCLGLAALAASNRFRNSKI